MTTTLKDMELGETKHWWDKLIAGVTGGAILAFGVALLKFAEKALPFLVKRKAAIDVINGITDQSPVYAEMENAITNDGAQRVIMLAAHNGGHVPSILTPFYTSAIHVSANTVEHRQRASLYKDVRVDSHYIKLLEEMIRDGSYRFTPAKQSACILKDFYTSEGVTDSLIVYLGVWNNSLVYVSFSVFEGELSDCQVTLLKLRAAAMRRKIEAIK